MKKFNILKLSQEKHLEFYIINNKIPAIKHSYIKKNNAVLRREKQRNENKISELMNEIFVIQHTDVQNYSSSVK